MRNILEAPARFGADVVLLEDNHRSTPEVLATRQRRAGRRTGVGAARQGAALGRGRRAPRPALVACADESHQAAEVCARILERHERGIALRDQAVLVRTGHHSALLELELAARRIPFVKYGGLRFLEAAHVKDLVAACRLVENPRDELAWFRVLGLHDGVGPATARRAAAAAAGGTPPAELAPDLLVALADARALAGGGGDEQRPGAAIERVRVWLDPIVDRRYGGAGVRFGDLDALEQAAAAAPSLSRFLVELTLDPPASTGDLAGPPAPRRRLRHDLHHPLRQGRRVARRAPALARRRRPAVGPVDRRRRPGRGGAPAALRRHDPGQGRAALLRAAAPAPPPPLRRRAQRQPRLRAAVEVPRRPRPGDHVPRGRRHGPRHRPTRRRRRRRGPALADVDDLIGALLR